MNGAMQPHASASFQQAIALAAAGQVPQALLLLNRLAAAGDPAAMFQLAAWRIDGAIVPRDLAQARQWCRRAGEAGHDQAARFYVNMLANGTGGPADWQRALALLRARAAKDGPSRRQLDLVAAMALDETGDPLELPLGERLSKTPEVNLFRGAFTAAECAYMIEVAAPLLAPSTVRDPHTGRDVPHPGRTAHMVAFNWHNEDPAIHALNRRIAALSRTGVEQGEPLQVLRYAPGQEYKRHLDAVPEANMRVLTMLVYLNDDYEGGETSFSVAGLDVRGRRGDALLFRNITAHRRPDPDAEHAGLPVKKGEKLIISRWIHERPYVAPAAKGYA